LASCTQATQLILATSNFQSSNDTVLPKIEPITSATRILFFLQRAKNSDTLWKPTNFEESYFWVQRTEDVALLKRAAERTVDLRRKWEKAAATPDLKLRVAELLNSGLFCLCPLME